MSSIGPELPPHLASKRKRQAECIENENIKESQPKSNTHFSISGSPFTETYKKARQVCGPVLPHSAPSKQYQAELGRSASGNDDSDDDEGDYGPRLPAPASGDRSSSEKTWHTMEQQSAIPSDAGNVRLRRDEWMTVPPKQDDLAARMDPTKIKARKFNTGKGVKGPGQNSKQDNALWTETPEEKRKRLEDEQLGILKPPGADDESGEHTRKQLQDEEKARRINEHNVSENLKYECSLLMSTTKEKYRASSLLSQHQTSDQKQKEDDPTKRGFDYDKDMGAGAKVGQAQKRELLNRSAQFGSRFSGGSFL